MSSRAALLGFALAALFVAATATAHAQKISDREHCLGEESPGPFPRFIPMPQTTIPACTRLLNGGRLNEEDRLKALWLRADSYRAAKQYARAVADYSRMIALGSQEDRVYYRRGLNYHLLGRRAEAIGDFERVAGSSNPIVAEAARKALRDIGAAAPPTPPQHAGLAELIRKAQANENENGFCATVPWRDIRWREIVRHMDHAEVNSGYGNKDREVCYWSQVVFVGTTSDGSRCVRSQALACSVGGRCKVESDVWCKVGNDYTSTNCGCS
jgi:tetratricopeptide (TPR) repeat protein